MVILVNLTAFYCGWIERPLAGCKVQKRMTSVYEGAKYEARYLSTRGFKTLPQNASIRFCSHPFFCKILNLMLLDIGYQYTK